MHFHCRTWAWTWCPLQCVPLLCVPLLILVSSAVCPPLSSSLPWFLRGALQVAARVQTNQRYTNKVRSNTQCLYNGRVWQWWGRKQGGTRMERRGAQSCLQPIVSHTLALFQFVFFFTRTALSICIHVVCLIKDTGLSKIRACNFNQKFFQQYKVGGHAWRGGEHRAVCCQSSHFPFFVHFHTCIPGLHFCRCPHCTRLWKFWRSLF